MAMGSWDCNVRGCWITDTNWLARSHTGGYYGHNDEPLGKVFWRSRYNLNGAQFKSTRIRFTISTHAVDVAMSGMMLHGSHHDRGDEVAGTYEEKRKGSAGAGSTTSWGGTGYAAYSKRYLNHANVMEVAWEDTRVPQGYWYTYTKSPIAEDPNGDNVYAFRDSTYRFSHSGGAGFNNH
jgi:hypothetical protein